MTPPLPFPHALAVGLLGGSFNPAHDGHIHISLAAKRALGLRQVWWLVSPQNPLKSERGMADFSERLSYAKILAAPHRFIRVTALEATLDTRYTVDTLKALRRRYPRTRFVWLMGADNLAQFHRWKHWQHIAMHVPILALDRTPYAYPALKSRAAQRLKAARIPDNRLGNMASAAMPAWGYLHMRLHPASATALRNSLGGKAFLRHNGKITND